MAEIEIAQYLENFDEWIEAKPQYKKRLALFQSISAESPRGMVLVVAAELDRLLGEAIGLRLVRGKGLDELNDDSKGPLSTFSARINLAHALNIIEEQERRDLHLIRKVRNDFAHSVEASFETPSIASRLRELSGAEKGDSPEEVLERSALFLSMQLEACMEGLQGSALPTVARVYGPPAD